MHVYVESNFVLEVALVQEQHESCERLISLCEMGKIQLLVPAYSLVEPYETIIRFAKNRTRLSRELATEVRQLLRSKPYQEELDSLQNVTDLLLRTQDEEWDRLHNTRDRLLRITEVIPLTSTILTSAIEYQTNHDLSPQDAIVYASVLSHLSTSGSTSKCFLNRNSKDFDDPDIKQALNPYNCTMLFQFDHGWSYISSQVGSTSDP